MSLLTLDVAKCVRTTNKFSTCSSCVEACPVETIVIDEQIPSFVPSDCVGCGGCLGACPNGAYSLDDFNPINYVFSFLESANDTLTCKGELPCMAALSVDEMLSMALLKQSDISFDMSGCKSCDIAKINEPIISKRVEEVNFILEAMEQGIELLLDYEGSVDLQSGENGGNRRDFLAKVSIKEAAKAKVKFDNEVESLQEELKNHYASVSDLQKFRQKEAPDRRKLLMMAIRKVRTPSTYHILDSEDISFSSQKIVDAQSCTNCQMCYRICPTGALSSNDRGAFIAFDAQSCIKCASCHDVCEPDALSLKPTFALERLFKPKKELLVEFDIRRCDECGMPFAYQGGEVTCSRCRIEEEEAKALWGIE